MDESDFNYYYPKLIYDFFSKQHYFNAREIGIRTTNENDVACITIRTNKKCKVKITVISVDE
jgi:hypothetical protein